jgi:hypothetical protein
MTINIFLIKTITYNRKSKKRGNSFLGKDGYGESLGGGVVGDSAGTAHEYRNDPLKFNKRGIEPIRAPEAHDVQIVHMVYYFNYLILLAIFFCSLMSL